ncbi:chemokine XC receptor 1-like, partial [Scleropages formosus]
MSLIGNSLLLWALLKHEDKTKAWNIFLLNLTVSDLLFTMPLPFWAVYQFHQWVFGDLACKLLSGVFFIGLYSYMFFLVVITIDRYGAVVTSTYSWQTRRPLHAHFVSGGVWLVCTAASIPDVIFSETMETLGGTVCAGTPRPLHVELLMYCIQILLFFLVPFSVITFCYIKMWTIIVRCRSSQKHKAAKLILGIVIGFFVCWAPYNVLFFLFSLKSLGWDALVLEKLHYAYYICHCLAYCHCCLNPIFHIFGSRKFRTYFFLISGSSRMDSYQLSLTTAPLSNGTTTTDDYYYDYPNESLTFLDEDESWEFGGVFPGVLYCLVFSLSLIGNSLLLWALLKHEDKTKAWNIFLLNLTVSDLLFTMPLPFWAVYQFHQWVFGDLACKLLSGVFFIGLYSYMFFLVVITIDRYGAVVTSTYSWQTRRPLHAHFVSGGVWLVCTAASIPDVIFSETMETLGGTVCAGTPRPLHVELLMYCIQILLFFLVPFSVITFCYIKMWTIIVRCRSSQKHKAAKLILGIVIGFFVCWAPYNVLFFLFSLKSLGWDA